VSHAFLAKEQALFAQETCPCNAFIAIDPQAATGAAKTLVDGVQRKRLRPELHAARSPFRRPRFDPT